MSERDLAGPAGPRFRKLWIYTNYDCNLSCAYCCAGSTPAAARRAIGLDNVVRLVDEAVELGFTDLYFTGGEPFLLDEIYGMLAYASGRLRTSVLTNAMLLRGQRLERLRGIASDRLSIQVSLDGATPGDHDAYRGRGSWARTVEGIRSVRAAGCRVCLSTTETPANAPRLSEICAFHRSLGIPEEDHFVRPLARRGFSTEGLEVSMLSLAPEVTVNADGVFWHPLSTDPDMQVSKAAFPLAESVALIGRQMETIARTGVAPPLVVR
jgi:MoaA/NifB/PqqE/SkfB family radical SAM enzyme